MHSKSCQDVQQCNEHQWACCSWAQTQACMVPSQGKQGLDHCCLWCRCVADHLDDNSVILMAQGGLNFNSPHWHASWHLSINQPVIVQLQEKHKRRHHSDVHGHEGSKAEVVQLQGFHPAWGQESRSQDCNVATARLCVEAHRHDHQRAIHVLHSLEHIQDLNIDVHIFVHAWWGEWHSFLYAPTHFRLS